MVEAVKATYKVIGISGSLREKSTNKAAIKLAATLNPRLTIELADINDFPVYNGDIEEKGIPESVKRLA